MSDHVCKWETQFEGMESYISCITCGHMIFDDEIDRRLNATEQLGAERANRIAYQLEKGKSATALRAYAKARGG